MSSDDVVDEYLTNTVSRDLRSLSLGKVLGSGAYRTVYEWLPDPTLVAKVEVGAGSFGNVEEWHTWIRVQDVPSVARWFAPAVQISDCGTILLMRRTMPASIKDLPEKCPSFLADRKVGNFGRFDGRIVCHDYGAHLLLEKGMRVRLVKADWWD